MNNYLIIEDWMGNYLEETASGFGRKVFDYVKLMIFAIIYSYSRPVDGKQSGVYYGTQQDLAKMCFCAEASACRKLKELVDDEIIIKEENVVFGFIKRNIYKANLDKLSEYNSKLSLHLNSVDNCVEVNGQLTSNQSQLSSNELPDDSQATKYNIINNTINKSKYILRREEPKSFSSNDVYINNSVYLAGRKKQNSRGPSRGAAASFGQSLPIDPVRSNMTF